MIRYLHGYLQIMAVGFSAERFLNLCKNKNIEVWDLHPENDFYKMCIKVSDFRKIRPIVKKTRTKIIINKRCGFPFFLYRFRKRKLFFAGIILSLVFVILMSMRIWTIDLEGNQIITQDVMKDFLLEKGIKPGIKRSEIECEQLSSDIRGAFQEIKWVSISLNGTELEIMIKENHDKNKITETNNEPCNIIADKKGIITKIVTRNGVPQCKIGESVEPGKIIISGQIDVINDLKEVIGTKYVSSDAEIWAETTYLYQDSISRIYMKKNYLENKMYDMHLRIKNLNLMLELSRDTDYLNEDFTNEFFFGNEITLQIKERRLYEFVNDYYSEADRENILKEHFELFCDERQNKNCRILENNLKIIHQNNKSTAYCIIKMEEKIGEKRKIFDLSSENMVQ